MLCMYNLYQAFFESSSQKSDVQSKFSNFQNSSQICDSQDPTLTSSQINILQNVNSNICDLPSENFEMAIENVDLKNPDPTQNYELDIETVPILFEEDISKDLELQSLLYYPRAPQRTGKRNSERTHFCISSSTWKNIYNEKQSLKEKVQKEKEDRKLQRLQEK